MGGGALKAPDVLRESASRDGLAEVVRGRERFLALKTGWDEALVSGTDPSPALEHDFLRLWLENFSPGANQATCVVRHHGRIAAALGFTLAPATVDGVPLRLARSWTNAHSTRGGVLLGVDGADVLGTLVERIAREPWDALELRDLPRTGTLIEALHQQLVERGLRTHVDGAMNSPYITLPDTWEELSGRLDARFRQNLRRRRRRLEEQGEVGVDVVRTTDGLDQALEDAFAIEASGWKGRDGSAIRSSPDTMGFYAAWARQLAAAGRLRLSFLRVGGKRIAFHFAHVTRGRYHLPKCGFDEAWRECSPGQLLMVEVLQRCLEERVETFEFLGHTMTWKRDWTPLVRPHATLWAFRRNLPGTAAWVMRAGVRPLAAAALRRVKTRLSRSAR